MSLSIAQTARYLQLQSCCFLLHVGKHSTLVPADSLTAESRACNPLPATDACTESYIKWVLDLPLNMPLREQEEMRVSIAKLVCTQMKALIYQREQVRRLSS